jgi:hypothetical protein
MHKSAGFILLFLPCAFVLALAGSSSAANAPQESELYAGWLKMYDLRFDEAHLAFAAWKQSHSDDSLGPASNAAAYLFSELARLGALESELFVNDFRFKDRAKLRPDPATKALFVQEIARADRLANVALQRSGADSNALFVKSMTLGLRADSAGLIEKQSFAALSYTKKARVFAERLIRAKPEAADAYLGPGVDYLLSLKPAPLRVLLRVTGSNVDRERGPARDSRDGASRSLPGALCKAATGSGGVAREQSVHARELLGELHQRFPDNELYTREMDRIEKGAH